jgi:hypothetical protein
LHIPRRGFTHNDLEAMGIRYRSAGIGLALIAPAAEAYVGPGLGVGVVGTLLGAVAVVFLALAGLVWYPVKRLLGRRKPPEAVSDDGPPRPEEPASDPNR